MTKYRIYEIAKELNLDNKKVLGFLADHKITVKNHMSTVEAGVRDMIVKGLKANQGSVKEAAQNAARKVQEKAAQAAAPVAAKVAQVKSDIAVGKAAIQAHHAAQQKPAQESRNDRNDRRNDGRGENRGHDRNGQNHSERRGDRLQNSQNGQNRDNGRRNDRSQNGQNRSNGNGSSRFGRNDRNGGNQNRSGNGGNNRNKPQNGRAGKPGAPIGGNSAHAGKDMGKRNNNHNHQENGRNQGLLCHPGGPSYPQCRSYDENHKHKNNNSNRNAAPARKAEVVRPTSIEVGESISVKDFAKLLCRDVNEVIKKLFMLGKMVTINQEIDHETAELVGMDFNCEIKEPPPEADPTEVPEVEDDPALRVPRPPW